MARAPARRLPAFASALLVRDAPHGRRAEEQRLLQDQDEGCGNDIARIAAGRVEQRLRQRLDRRATGQRRVRKAAVDSRSARSDLRRDGAACFGDSLQRAIEQKEVCRIDKSRDSSLVAFQHLLLGVFGDADDREHLAPCRAPPARRPGCPSEPSTLIASSASRV